MYKTLAVIIFLNVLFVCSPLTTLAQIITTYAGDTVSGYTGDGGPAIVAHIKRPNSIAVDRTGNLFIADITNHVIRKVDASGIITTYAGTGIGGYNGDGIAATSAQLHTPQSLATDKYGNLYITEAFDCRIRKVDTDGVISTVYNDPTHAICPRNIAVNWKGVVYFTTLSNIYKFTGTPVSVSGTTMIMAVNGMTFDTVGNLYLTNTTGSPSQVLKMDTFGVYTVLAGSGSIGIGCPNNAPGLTSGLYMLAGIARDNAGNLYFSEIANARVLKMDAAGTITTYAGTCYNDYHIGDHGPATAAGIGVGDGSVTLNAIAMDPAGDLYIAEPKYNAVRKVTIPGLTLRETVLQKETVTIDPNPASGLCRLHISTNKNESVKVVVTDVTGRQMLEYNARTNTDNNVQFDLPPGMYYISAFTANGRINNRFTVR